jgi:hypothetical protein
MNGDGRDPSAVGDMIAIATLVVLAGTSSLSASPESLGAFQDGQGSDFEGELEKVRLVMSNRHWAQARERIFELLDEHRGETYVLAHWAELEEMQKQCFFWMEYDEPEPKDVVHGELLSYSASSGKIKLRYRSQPELGRTAPWDFEVKGKFWIHPAVFADDYTLNVKGAAGGKITLVACMEARNYHGAFFDPEVSRAFRLVDGDTEWLDRSRNAVDVSRGVEVRVKNTKIAYYGGKVAMTAAKPKGVWGQAGLYEPSRVEEVLIAGKVEPSWIDGLIDQRVQEALTAFEEEYDPAEFTPDWLAAMLEDGSEGGARAPAHPGPDHPRHAEHLERARALIDSDSFQALVNYAKGLGQDETTEELRAWLITLGLWHLDQSDDDLLEACERVVALDPEFLRARRLHVRLVSRVRPRAEAVEAGRRYAADFPLEPEASSRLVRILLLAGRREEAEAEIAAAMARGLSPKSLEEIRGVMARAAHGPQWSRTFEWKSKNFLVRSDLDEKVCFETAEVLETAYRKWNLHLRRVGAPSRERYSVFIFSGEAGYLKYAEGVLIGAPENSWGVFSPTLKQLLIWNLRERETMFRTVRHEGFHQYFDELVGVGPSWLNEGLAEYYETTRMVSGRWVDGALHPHHVAYLADRNHDLVPLGEFLRWDSTRFYADGFRNYAQAWGLVHFLLHAKARPEGAFDAHLDALIEGAGIQAARQCAFGDLDLDALDSAFRSYVRSLR